MRYHAALARLRLLDYCQFVDPAYITAPHINLMAEKLEGVERGDIKKLMLFVPPRHGKSQLASIHFPAWAIGRNPDRRVIHAAYSAELSTSFSRQVRNEIEDQKYRCVFDVHMSDDSRDVSNWSIKGHRGGMIAAGVGGSITGYGADIFIIDDPVKNQQEAESEIFRDRVYEWYQSVARTRLEPNGAIILIMTRWHQKDLAGRILENEKDWNIVNLPAIAREDDPLGRAPGQALWPARYNEQALSDIQHDVGTRSWTALYDGMPTDPASAIIKRDWIRWYEAMPPQCTRFGGIDTATSQKTSADNMAFIDVAVCRERFLWVDDAFCEKTTVTAFAKHVSNMHRVKRYSMIKIEENNAGAAVKQRIDEVGREEKTFPPVIAEQTTTDKVVRVMEFQHLIENGTLRFRKGSKRITELVEHLIAFDGKGGDTDDDVDALGFAIKAALGGGRSLIHVG